MSDFEIEPLNLGGCLPVNEIFETLQGEATYTGTPAVFVRLQGCPVGCGFCDTKHTWSLRAQDEIPVDEMLRKVEPAQTYAMVSPRRLVMLVQDFRARHVVITGGEPCLYDLRDAVEALVREGYSVQIETSGTHIVQAGFEAWVTVSPKLGMPGGLEVRPEALLRADEIKMPVGKLADVEALEALLSSHVPFGGVVWLQPLSRSPKATALCIEEATKRGWKVSIQVHSFIGVR